MQATLAAILGGGAAYAFGCDGLTCVAAAGLGIVTARIALIDLKQRIINDNDIIALAAIGFYWRLWPQYSLCQEFGIGLIQGLLYAGILQAIRLEYFRRKGRYGIGFGDIKLVGAAGFLLSYDLFAITITLAALSGLIFSFIRVIVKRRSVSLYSNVPLGTFLALAIFFIKLTNSILQ